MRIWEIALFMFIFNLMLAVLSGLGIFNVSVGQQTPPLSTTEAFSGINSTLSRKAVAGEGVSMNDILITGYDAVKTTAVTFVTAPIAFYGIMTAFGVPSIIAVPILSITVLIYIVGILQLLIGRSFKQTE